MSVDRTCRGCGCTDERACVLVDPGDGVIGSAQVVAACWWAEDDLCSACSEYTLEALEAHAPGFRWHHPDASRVAA